MLVFVDESWQTIAGTEVAALGAVAIPARRYNQFCRQVFAAKSRILGANELSEQEIKGQKAFGRASFTAQSHGVTPDRLQAANALCTALVKSEAKAFAYWTTDTTHVKLKSASTSVLGKPYAELLHDLHALGESYNTPRNLALHFDQRSKGDDTDAACAIQNFLVRWASGKYAKHILVVPNFVSSAVSPGLQAADIVAYLAAQSYDRSHRPELRPWFLKLDDLAFTRKMPKGKTRLCVREV